MTPFVDDADFTLFVGDVRAVLAELPAGSVNCCVTSPPYWGLRDYGTDGQIGLEPTLDEYVAALVEVFRDVRRVLADDGTLWLNLGDSYNSNESGGMTGSALGKGGQQTPHNRIGRPRANLKPKDMVGVPWRVAFALQDDGWYLRSDIIWAKPNPMPESVTDRPTKAHEYVFLLSKSPRYYFDQEAVREDAAYPGPRWSTTNRSRDGSADIGQPPHRGLANHVATGRNIRSVWEIATQPYAEAHFATFPEELPRRCIAAGCPEWVCATCGKARERLIERTRTLDGDPVVSGGWKTDEAGRIGADGVGHWRKASHSETTGWSDCGHDDYRPGVVLDPFMGSGTTALVARKLGRRAVGVELSPEYAALCARRLQQLSLLA